MSILYSTVLQEAFPQKITVNASFVTVRSLVGQQMLGPTTNATGDDDCSETLSLLKTVHEQTDSNSITSVLVGAVLTCVCMVDSCTRAEVERSSMLKFPTA